jgi:hypothetical protein
MISRDIDKLHDFQTSFALFIILKSLRRVYVIMFFDKILEIYFQFMGKVSNLAK